MGNKSENYSSPVKQFFLLALLCMFEAFFCLKCKVTTWLPLLYRWKIPCENDDDDNYVFRQKLHLAKLLSYTGCNTTKYLISSILNNQKFQVMLRRKSEMKYLLKTCLGTLYFYFMLPPGSRPLDAMNHYFSFELLRCIFQLLLGPFVWAKLCYCLKH